jgi:hypothetical protein
MDAQGNKRRTLIVKEYTLHDLALVYEMSKYRMRCRIAKYKKEVGKRIGYFYETEQVRKIFQLIPLPSDIDLV